MYFPDSCAGLERFDQPQTKHQLPLLHRTVSPLLGFLPEMGFNMHGIRTAGHDMQQPSRQGNHGDK